MKDLLAGIMRDLESEGYAIANLSDDEYLYYGRRLGEIVSADFVSIAQGSSIRSTSLSRSEALPLHTDHPEIDIVGWRCEIEDPAGVGISLLNMMNATQLFEREELEEMSTIRLLYPLIGNYKKGIGMWPLVSMYEHAHFYYAPWLVPDSLTKKEFAIIKNFSGHISRRAMTDLSTIRMTLGTCLFVNNHRLLHGRRRIHPNSPRRFKRLWIRQVSSFY